LKKDVITPGMSLKVERNRTKRTPKKNPKKAETVEEAELFEYKVKPGDNLSTIAERFDVAVSLQDSSTA
jgi:LysM repeat protein